MHIERPHFFGHWLSEVVRFRKFAFQRALPGPTNGFVGILSREKHIDNTFKVLRAKLPETHDLDNYRCGLEFGGASQVRVKGVSHVKSDDPQGCPERGAYVA